MVAARPQMHGVGFVDPSVDDSLRISGAEERATIWERLGICPSDENINGQDYFWDKDDPTLRAMAEKYRRVYAPQIAANLKTANHDPLKGAIESTDIGQLPLFLDSGFFDITPKDVIVARDLRRTPWKGKTVNWNSMTARGAAIFDTAEIPTLSDQDNTYEAQQLSVKLMYGKITLSGLSMATAEPFVNLMNWEIQARVRAMLELTEATTLTGTGAGGSWKGMQALFTDNTSSPGGDIDLDEIDALLEIIWNSGGNPDRGIAPHSVVNQIGAILRDNQRVQIPAQTTAIGGWQGLRNFVIYNGIPIFGSRFMPNTPTARELYLYQQDVLDYPVLVDTVIEPLAKTTDAESWMMKTYMVFRDRSGTGGAGEGGTYHGLMDTLN